MNTQEMMSKQIIVEDLILQYYVRQSNSKKSQVLVFLHGWRSCSQTWFPFIETFSNLYTIICLDLPGFGKSQSPNMAFALLDYATVVKAFLHKLEISSCILVGHSFGGAIGIKLVSTNTSKVSKLILIDASGIRKKKLILKIIKIIATISKPLFNLKLLHSLKKNIYQKYGWDDYLATPQLKETYLKIINEDVTELLHLIKVPTLLLWGDKDMDTPLSHAHLMKQRISNSDLKILENAGHFSFLDKSKETSQYILDFINK